MALFGLCFGYTNQYCPNCGYWSYLIEMEMGSEPETGIIGYETAILLFETDIILPQDEPVATSISA
ncbi:hypothetical protein [Nostoc favosum]|uniref:Uncharacterized protein n=1 Tax=Nostoc favosum CHAB5714 TaxID=2780399 RepID=A0ABS8IL17_9NOSO|nr:hypothetical protein [Nostoc favosum]MCC5604721.1 hypothetical protein [Nostoc favosum CHAB5714]